MFSRFDRVVIASDDFEDLGVPPGAICFILDLYTSDEFELEYSEVETGVTIATFSARSDQVRPLDD